MEGEVWRRWTIEKDKKSPGDVVPENLNLFGAPMEEHAKPEIDACNLKMAHVENTHW